MGHEDYQDISVRVKAAVVKNPDVTEATQISSSAMDNGLTIFCTRKDRVTGNQKDFRFDTTSFDPNNLSDNIRTMLFEAITADENTDVNVTLLASTSKI